MLDLPVLLLMSILFNGDFAPQVEPESLRPAGVEVAARGEIRISWEAKTYGFA